MSNIISPLLLISVGRQPDCTVIDWLLKAPPPLSQPPVK